VVRTFVALASVRQIENHSIATMLIVHRITQSGVSVVRRPYDHTLGISVIPQRVLHAAVSPDSLLSPMDHRLSFRRVSRTLLAFVSVYGRSPDGQTYARAASCTEDHKGCHQRTHDGKECIDGGE
jgi:hypothetical protein